MDYLAWKDTSAKLQVILFMFTTTVTAIPSSCQQVPSQAFAITITSSGVACSIVLALCYPWLLRESSFPRQSLDPSPSPWAVSADTATAPTTNMPSTAPSHNSEVPTLDAVLPTVPIQTPGPMWLLPQHPIPDQNDTNPSAKAIKMHVGPKHNGQQECWWWWYMRSIQSIWDRLGKVKQWVYDDKADTLATGLQPAFLIPNLRQLD
ncbi:hypothetical protein BS17DRAFT_770004 [Gyrodon lividus]|nr:hypothetical protein BS17DRAFT_770004 [Gyrodon lividus]